MASGKAKTQQQKTTVDHQNSPPLQASSETGLECTQQERQLLDYVATNSQWIVNALTTASSRAGNHNQWAEQQQYLTMATTISQFTGLEQTLSASIAPPIVRAASAGSPSR